MTNTELLNQFKTLEEKNAAMVTASQVKKAELDVQTSQLKQAKAELAASGIEFAKNAEYVTELNNRKHSLDTAIHEYNELLGITPSTNGNLQQSVDQLVKTNAEREKNHLDTAVALKVAEKEISNAGDNLPPEVLATISTDGEIDTAKLQTTITKLETDLQQMLNTINERMDRVD